MAKEGIPFITLFIVPALVFLALQWWIAAILCLILAAFMAVTKVKDDNICQVMVKVKSEEVNAWSYYQSKSVKQNLAELGRAQLAGLSRTTSGDARAQIDAHVARYDAEIARYETEKADIKFKAEQHEKIYNGLNFRDDQFDLSDATLSISMAMLAVTALTGKRWLLLTSWAVGGFGALLGIAGLTGLNLHPGWLIKLLS
jgi:type IV secretory pathway VirB3-like protein